MSTLLVRLGHYFSTVGPWILIGSAVVDVIVGENTTVRMVNIFIMSPVIAVMGIGFLKGHNRKPCGICARNMPLNPGVRAERLKPAFRAFHLVAGSMRNVLLSFLLGPGVAFGVLLAFGSFWGNLAWLFLVAIPFGGLLLTGHHHQQLQPWCPWCRRGRGDDKEAIQAPDPSPAAR